jgi:hypothetical protein
MILPGPGRLKGPRISFERAGIFGRRLVERIEGGQCRTARDVRERNDGRSDYWFVATQEPISGFLDLDFTDVKAAITVPASKPSAEHFLGQLIKGKCSCGVQLKGRANKRRLFRIYRLYLAFTAVNVAERSGHRVLTRRWKSSSCRFSSWKKKVGEQPCFWIGQINKSVLRQIFPVKNMRTITQNNCTCLLLMW